MVSKIQNFSAKFVDQIVTSIKKLTFVALFVVGTDDDNIPVVPCSCSDLPSEVITDIKVVISTLSGRSGGRINCWLIPHPSKIAEMATFPESDPD